MIISLEIILSSRTYDISYDYLQHAPSLKSSIYIFLVCIFTNYYLGGGNHKPIYVLMRHYGTVAWTKNTPFATHAICAYST